MCCGCGISFQNSPNNFIRVEVKRSGDSVGLRNTRLRKYRTQHAVEIKNLPFDVIGQELLFAFRLLVSRCLSASNLIKLTCACYRLSQ